jgi:hypothetical protein
MPIILAIWEAEIGNITVQNEPGQIDLISKKTPQQNRLEVWLKQQGICFASAKP